MGGRSSISYDPKGVSVVPGSGGFDPNKPVAGLHDQHVRVWKVIEKKRKEVLEEALREVAELAAMSFFTRSRHSVLEQLGIVSKRRWRLNNVAAWIILKLIGDK